MTMTVFTAKINRHTKSKHILQQDVKKILVLIILNHEKRNESCLNEDKKMKII